MLFKPIPPQEILAQYFEYSVITGQLYRRSEMNRGRSSSSTGVGYKTRRGYILVGCGGDTFYAHRLIWRLITGVDPQELQVDHHDKDRSNNAWHNLRLTPHGGNIHNQDMHKDNQCGAKGVRRTTSGRFQARIYHQGTTFNLGCYATVEEANDAYRKKELELRGEFARQLDD